MAGLIPIMLSSSTGSDVTHRIAAPMLGGMLTVMILNLLVLPVIYSFVLQFQEIRRTLPETNSDPSQDGIEGAAL